MYFSQTSSPYNGIVQGIEFETGLGLGIISGNAAPDYWLAQFLIKINDWLNQVNCWIHEVDNEWPYDDSNHDNFPIETYATTDDQQDYALDSDISAIKKVEVHDADEATDEGWKDCDLQIWVDRDEDRFGEDSGAPTKYWLNGGSIIFDKPVDTDECDYYRITYDRQAHLFVIGDTTAEPGFAVPFHPILVFGPTMDWAQQRGKKDITAACYRKIFGNNARDPKDPLGLYQSLRRHYRNRAQEFNARLIRKAPAGGSWK